jgi:hypothetical protein
MTEAIVVKNDDGNMTKEEMIAIIEKLRSEKAELIVKVGQKSDGRKEQVLGLIRSEGRISIKDLAERIGISERNVSSQKSYLVKDGFKFGKDSKGRIYEETE